MTENSSQRKPVDFDELYPGRFLKGGEIPRPVTLRIASVYTERLPDDKGGERTRGIVTFQNTEKELILNRTNGECLKAMWGRQVQTWVGQRVTLENDPNVMFGREKVGGVRVLGSPDLEKPVTFSLKLPRRKPKQVTLICTAPEGRRSQPQRDREPGEDEY